MSEKQKIVILLDNFAKSEAESALAAYAGTGADASRIIVAPVTDQMAAQNSAKAIDDIMAGKWSGGTPRSMDRRGALIAGADKRSAVILMRCFKSVLPKGADAAFAMVTQTGLTWTVAEYLAHICKEHKFMKNANPADDPDMKAIEE
ncbi:MAG: hypothetical protein B6D68_01580 [spirochete symbiont of Stewartia floridana]|nr:MAG: hypothetical protein B6D68_01580 [spirochete symbiont of Stewartia floridana]